MKSRFGSIFGLVLILATLGIIFLFNDDSTESWRLAVPLIVLTTAISAYLVMHLIAPAYLRRRHAALVWTLIVLVVVAQVVWALLR